MVFLPHASIPKLPFEIPDDIPVHEFLFNEKYGRRAIKDSLPAFTDAVTGKSYKAEDVRNQIEFLARSLSKRLGWKPEDSAVANLSRDHPPNPDSKLLGGKVLCVFSYNTVSMISKDCSQSLKSLRSIL